MSELEHESPLSATCRNCYQVMRIPEAWENMFREGKVACPDCEGNFWKVASSLVKYSATHLAQSVDTFDDKLSAWLASDEGKSAVLQAEYDPRRPQ